MDTGKQMSSAIADRCVRLKALWGPPGRGLWPLECGLGSGHGLVALFAAMTKYSAETASGRV